MWAQALRTLRGRMTQAEMATMLDVPPAAIARAETGEGSPALTVTVAERLGVLLVIAGGEIAVVAPKPAQAVIREVLETLEPPTAPEG